MVARPDPPVEGQDEPDPVTDSDLVNGVVSVRAGSASVTGEIRRAGASYVNLIDGDRLGGPTGLEYAIHRLTMNIRLRLPVVAPEGWQVVVECDRGGRYKVEFADTDLHFEADDAWRDEVWLALQDLPRHTLSDAIESAAALVRLCVQIQGREQASRGTRSEES